MTEESKPYVESPIIMTVVRVVSPFILTFGLFITVHGADSPGGGFQGGVVIASMFILLGFAFGIGPTRRWINNRVLGFVTAVGLAIFLVLAFLSAPLVGELLRLDIYGFKMKWGVELVEFGIGLVVSGVIVSLFLLVAWGQLVDYDEDQVDEEEVYVE